MQILNRQSYTQAELEEAQAFLRERLRNEYSMENDVEGLLEEYAERLLILLLRDASQEEINALVDELAAQLLEDCEILAADEHDRKDEILAYIGEDRNGDNLQGRIEKRCKTFYNEVFAVFMAGKLLGKSSEDIVTSIRENLKNPWSNPILDEVRESIEHGKVAGNIDDYAMPHFGQGVEISSFGALKTITRYAIADGWMWWGYTDARAQGAKGFYVQRGSTFPCSPCDDAVAHGFYPIDEEIPVPVHLNCCCIIIYSYTDRL